MNKNIRARVYAPAITDIAYLKELKTFATDERR